MSDKIYDERFEMWLKKNSYVENEDIDIDTLREVFEAMDDEDK